MEFLRCLGCLLFASLVGSLMMVDANSRNGGWQFSELFWYPAVLVVASPFWAFTFLPLYTIVSAKSVFWRWYISPFIGAVIGLPGGIYLLSGDNSGIMDVYWEKFLAPIAVGFCTFLLGTIFKKLSSDLSN